MCGRGSASGVGFYFWSTSSLWWHHKVLSFSLCFFFPIICWSSVWLVINSSPVKGKNIKENSFVSMIGTQNDRLNYSLWYCLTGLTTFSFRGLWISFTEFSWQPNGGRRAIGCFLKSGFLFGFIKMDLFLEGCIFHILAPSPSECG